MFSAKLTRAAHRATGAVPGSSTSPTCIPCLATAHARHQHQRRQSSSKASWPPDNSTSKPAPAAKAAGGEQEQPASASASTSTSAPTQQRSSKGRSRGGHSKKVQEGKNAPATAAEPIDQFAGLPSVPSVQNLGESERSISNFFALHRPMSLTTTFPPAANQEDFGNIFETTATRDPWENGNSAEGRPEDVVYTLHSSLETVESGAQDEGVRWEILSQSPSNNTSDGVKHLDGQPRMKSLEDLVAQFKPFRAPPPPRPFVEQGEQKLEKKTTSPTQKSARGRAKQKTFTATITVTESTDANGQKTYSASSSPIVRLPDTAEQQEQRDQRDHSTTQQATSSQRTSRRDRMRRQKQLLYANTSNVIVYRIPTGLRGERVRKIFAISVKRQRKLKMKKHKYKKLMKRTRNLRRRLERN